MHAKTYLITKFCDDWAVNNGRRAGLSFALYYINIATCQKSGEGGAVLTTQYRKSSLLTLTLLSFFQEIPNVRIQCGIQWVKHNFHFQCMLLDPDYHSFNY